MAQGIVQIEREIGRQLRPVEDFADQLAVAGAEADGVVLDVGAVRLQAEIDDEERHREFLALQAFRRRGAAFRAGQELVIGVHDVGIGGDEVGGKAPSVLQDNGRGAAVRELDLCRLRRQMHRAAEILKQPHHAGHERAGAAAREPDAPLPLQRMDQRIDRRRREGIAADEQRMEGKGLPKLPVLNEARDLGIDAAPGLQAGELRAGLHHVAEVEERYGCRASDSPLRTLPSSRRGKRW